VEREVEVWWGEGSGEGGGKWGGEGSGGMERRGKWRYVLERGVEREEEVHCKKVSIHCVLLYTILTSWHTSNSAKVLTNLSSSLYLTPLATRHSL